MSERVIVAVPYPGEFGWELMNWQARVRWVFARHPRARRLVFAPSDRRSLYAYESARSGVEFIASDELSWPGEANEDHRLLPDGTRIPADTLRCLMLSGLAPSLVARHIDLARVDWLMPTFDGRLWPTRSGVQRFVSFRRSAIVSTDVLLIPRRRATAAERNSPDEWWVRLARLLHDAGQTTEIYDGPFDHAVAQLSRARLAVGASTGGLHLASLTQTPHFVWGCDDARRWTSDRMTNRQRYETYWNPLGTPCVYDECGWQPAAAYVFHRVLDLLDRIGLPRAACRPVQKWRPRWRWRRGLARLTENHWGNPTPWRIRRLVREQLV